MISERTPPVTKSSLTLTWGILFSLFLGLSSFSPQFRIIGRLDKANYFHFNNELERQQFIANNNSDGEFFLEKEVIDNNNKTIGALVMNNYDYVYRYFNADNFKSLSENVVCKELSRPVLYSSIDTGMLRYSFVSNVELLQSVASVPDDSLVGTYLYKTGELQTQNIREELLILRLLRLMMFVSMEDVSGAKMALKGIYLAIQ